MRTLTPTLAITLTLAAVTLLASGPAFRADQDVPAVQFPAAEAVAGPAPTAPAAEERATVPEDQERSIKEQEKALSEQDRALKEQVRALREQEKVIRIIGSDRPRIGIILETEADPDSDPIGARIQAVTPGGPADQAGLKADDIIVKFKGQALAGPSPDADPDESAPATKLLALTKGLKDGEKVVIEYRRGKETKTTTVVPRTLKEKNMRVVVNIPDLKELKELRIPELDNLPENFDFTFDLPGDVLDMELVELNPDLGDYFGTSMGLLVVSAPADSPLKLKGGDVILKIGDRKPATPSQALRILRSYEPKETVTIEVLRKRQRVTLTSAIPERRSPKQFQWRSKAPQAPAPPDGPAPPQPSAAPAPPAGIS